MFSKLKTRAFSLVELLVVISVLVILIGISIPRIKGFQENAKKLQVKKELQSIEAALQSYYTFANPKAYPPSNSTISNSYLLNASPKAISTVLYDPLNTTSNTEYGYKRSSNGKYYVVYSTGLNGTASDNIVVSDGGYVRGIDNDDTCLTNGNGCSGLSVCGSYQCSLNGACQGGNTCIDAIDSTHWGVHISNTDWAAQDWNDLINVDPIGAYTITGTCPGVDCELVVSNEAICDWSVQTQDLTQLSIYLGNYICP